MKNAARGRDIAWVTGLAWLTLAGLALSGAVGAGPAAAAAFAILCLAAIYFLLSGRDQGEHGAAVAPAAAAPPPAEDVASAMIERLPDAVLLISQGGRIERANAAARAFLALSREAANVASVLRQPDVLEAVSAALRGEQPDPVEYRTHAPYEGFVKAFAAPLAVGGRAGAIMVLHDETDMRRAEQMRAQFLANASHELRTPLASLAGFIETLRGHARDDPDARDRFLGIMQGQTERMRRLINDLLSLSRIEMNEHLPPSGAVDLAVVVGDVADALRPIARARGAELAVRAPDEGAVVTGDRDQLTAVVQNLVDNALKYSPHGGVVRVEVLTGDEAAEAIRPRQRGAESEGRYTIVAPAAGRPMAAVRVTDQGPGIEPAHLPRLAQRFYRVEEGKAEDRKGTGLGLAIVKHVAARHRGGFAVESAPGRGSSFVVSAPLAAPAGPAPAAARG
jgi:two-component system phosphate regulon sensor histidine kinase PhoR